MFLDGKIIMIRNIRKHGTPPYRIAVIHGGPGAIGSLGYMAERIAESCGVIEPLQSKYSVAELIEELHEQLKSYLHSPIILLGHSWGAWLSIMYTVYHPQSVKALILIGTPPFEDKYVSLIMDRRFANLSKHEAIRLKELLKSEAEMSIREIEELLYKCDNHSPLPKDIINQYTAPVDYGMNQLVWEEAAKMRTEGGLCKLISQIKCPIHLIHGECDPHPFEGVGDPLKLNGIAYSEYVLPRCGHSPFYELEWSAKFYSIIATISSQIKPYHGRVPACGVFCGGCPTYTREKKACLGADKNKARCEKCKTFHLCCVEKGISHCFQCSMFPCVKFKSFTKRWLKYGQDFIENQRLLEKVGDADFIRFYNDKIIP